MTHKGKAAVIDEAFESQPNSKGATPAGSVPGTPSSNTTPLDTPAGSGDEAVAADATLAGVDAVLAFKSAKGRKKMTRKQMKDREERRRLRTGQSFHFFTRARIPQADQFQFISSFPE